jgi:hypothetical protein
LFKFLLTRVTFDYRTLCFAYISGTLLSVPIGMALEFTGRPFVPPDWTEAFYCVAVLLSLAIQPYWIDTMLRGRQELQRFGKVMFCITIALFLVIALFPRI